MKALQLDKPLDANLKPVKDSDGTLTALQVSTDKVRVKNLEVSSIARGIEPTDGSHFATKNYTDSSHRFSFTRGGYCSSASTTYYENSLYPTYQSWTNAEPLSDVETLSYQDSMSATFMASYDGTIDGIQVVGRATGTDPFKIYVYGGKPVNGAVSVPCVLLAKTSSITPYSNTTLYYSAADASAAFGASTGFYIWFKKDSNSGNSTAYFSITINGTYTS